MQYERFNDRQFIDYFRTYELAPGSTVFLGSESELHRYWWLHGPTRIEAAHFMEFPNIQALSLMHLLFLVGHGATRVIAMAPDNSSESPLVTTIKEANEICRAFFDGADRVSMITLHQDSPTPQPQGLGTPDHESYRNTGYRNRRRKLSSLLEFFHQQSGRDISVSADTVRSLNTIICDEQACTQCLACLNCCSIEALSADPASFALSWTGAVCIGCGACVRICPENALALSGEITITAGFFTPMQLSQAEPMSCRECGKIFGTKKSFMHVQSILAKRAGKGLEHLDYCEDCRVIKLFGEP